MDSADKLTQLRALTESEFRREVLIPLLARIGYQAPTEYHGSREHGKDIVCFDIDRLGERRYLAIVAKTSDLSGSVSSDRGLMEILNQTEQSFNESYHDLFGMRRVTMHEVWVVTSGRVVPGAADSVFGKLEKTNLAKLVRIIPGERLIELIDRHFPTYWSRASETPEQVRAERDRYRNFLSHLLRSLGSSPERCEEVITVLSQSGRAPSISVNEWDLTSISSYWLQLEAVSDRYPMGTTSFECGNIRSAFRAARKSIWHELIKVDEIVYKAERVFKCIDPLQFLQAFEKDLAGDYPFYRSDVPFELSLFEAGINEVNRYLARLDAAGAREEAVRYMAAIESLRPIVEGYIEGADKEQFELAWELTDDSVVMRSDGIIDEGKRGFVTRHKRKLEKEDQWHWEVTLITTDKIIEAVQLGLRAHFEHRLPVLASDV